MALYGTHAFLIAPGLGAFTGLSSQRGLKLHRRYPESLSRSPGMSGTLIPSSRSMPHDMRLCSLPVRYTSRNSLRPVREDFHPLFRLAGTSGYFFPAPVSCSHQFAGCATPAGHGIKQPGYSDQIRINQPPPPRTVQAPLRAHGATLLSAGQADSGTAGETGL